MPERLETVPLDSLVPDPANVRCHPERNKAAALSSLKRFGAARSIVVDKNGVVRAGNATLEAARQAGITRAVVVETAGDELVVVRRPDWSDTEATGYAVADNRVAELAEFDDAALAQTLQALQQDGLDLADVGFAQSELDSLLEHLEPPPEPVAPESFAAYDEAIETEYCCPKCNYRWSGKPA